MNRIRALVMAVGLSVVFGPIVGGTPWNPDPVVAAPTLNDLASVDDLKMLFNQDRGKAKLVLLLSPT